MEERRVQDKEAADGTETSGSDSMNIARKAFDDWMDEPLTRTALNTIESDIRGAVRQLMKTAFIQGATHATSVANIGMRSLGEQVHRNMEESRASLRASRVFGTTNGQG